MVGRRNSGVSARQELTVMLYFFFSFHAGLLADEYRSYLPTFYMTGIIIVVSSAIIFLLPFVKSKNQRTDANSDEMFLVVEKCTVV